MPSRNPRGHVDPARRKLLLALGFGAANVGLVRRLGSAGSASTVVRSTGDTSPPPSTSAPAPGGIGTPPADPGTAPVLDPSAEVTDPAHVFDLVIRGGRVMDPDSGFDGLVEVGVDSGRVARIGPGPLEGRAVVDAAGQVVAPGFIDILSYAPNGYGEWYKIADGITTNLGMHGLDTTAAEFFGRWDAEGAPVHFGGASDNAHLRPNRGLDPYDEATAQQVVQLVADAETDLHGGFLGVHMQPEYTPGTTFDEIRRHGELCASLGVPLCLHARYSDDLPPGVQAEALDEVLRVARETGVRVHVEHINSTGGTGRMEEALATLQAGIDEGLGITACVYPYTFWATYLKSARFDDWQEKYGISYDSLQVAGTEERLTESTFPAAYEANKLTAAFTIPEADIEMALRAPWVMLGSDAILESHHNNHPRATGCFSRLFGVYVRERSVLSLMDALAKVTILPARLLEPAAPALTRKGRLQVGADADLCIFDPNTIVDRSTIADPAQESVGVTWVLVNGVVVKDASGVKKDQRPGTAIRSEL